MITFESEFKKKAQRGKGRVCWEILGDGNGRGKWGRRTNEAQNGGNCITVQQVI